jgi:hypothetical protein
LCERSNSDSVVEYCSSDTIKSLFTGDDMYCLLDTVLINLRPPLLIKQLREQRIRAHAEYSEMEKVLL